jgi:hypothetical protein
LEKHIQISAQGVLMIAEDLVLACQTVVLKITVVALSS